MNAQKVAFICTGPAQSRTLETEMSGKWQLRMESLSINLLESFRYIER